MWTKYYNSKLPNATNATAEKKEESLAQKIDEVPVPVDFQNSPFKKDDGRHGFENPTANSDTNVLREVNLKNIVDLSAARMNPKKSFAQA